MEIFGFEIKRKNPNETKGAVVAPSVDDGSTMVTTSSAGYYGQTIDLEGVIKNENDLIKRYREVAQYSDCDNAITDIINESITSNWDEKAVDIVLDDVELSDSIKKKITDEFNEVLKLYKFNEKGHDMFRSWYIDGRIYYHILLDMNSPKKGIQELRFIDPRKIRRIKNVKKERNEKGVEVVKSVEEFYLFNDKGINTASSQGVKLSIDSVVYCPSGLMDSNTGMMLGHLHKAIKPVNQLKMMEDSLVIYRVSRAPDRRVFYVDVGNLPKMKAEQYVNDIMNKFRNKIVYDATTGEIRDDRKHLSMMEDFWMPRREGGRGTEITTLPGGQSLGQIEDINFFQNKLYQALNVPASRLQQQVGFSLGRSSEITRDEIKFNKFIERLRRKFSHVFNETMKIQLVSKGIMRLEEWEQISQDVRYDYQEDNNFAELRDTDILNNRLAALQQIEQFVGKYYSQEYVRKFVLRQSEEEIKDIDAQIETEREGMLQDAEFQAQHDSVRKGETLDQDQEQQEPNDSEGDQQ
jgi:polyhydroxyalkanoate synthesis regulator phasin